MAAEPEANFPDESGRNPLHIAALNGHVECVKVLCSKAHIPVNAVDHRGQTAAMHAAIAGSVEVLTFLLARGADSETPDADGNTCLLLAIRADKVRWPTAALCHLPCLVQLACSVAHYLCLGRLAYPCSTSSFPLIPVMSLLAPHCHCPAQCLCLCQCCQPPAENRFNVCLRTRCHRYR